MTRTSDSLMESDYRSHRTGEVVRNIVIKRMTISHHRLCNFSNQKYEE